MRKLITTFLCLPCAAVGALAGDHTRGEAAGAPPRVLLAPATAQPVPADLPASALRVDVQPRAIRAGRGGESLELAIDLKTGFRGKASVQYEYTIVRDDGAVVQAEARSPIARVGAGASSSGRMETPALADGYYRVHVTAAGSDTVEQVAASGDAYFHVDGGAITPLSARDYHARSNANRALPALPTPRLPDPVLVLIVPEREPDVLAELLLQQALGFLTIPCVERHADSGLRVIRPHHGFVFSRVLRHGSGFRSMRSMHVTRLI